MRLSYQWINEYVDIHDITPQELADRLTGVGLEVEGVTPLNAGVTGVVVGEVVHTELHPNADRLRVCQVDVGDGRLRTIVCGAPNVAAGQKVPAALPGAVLPGGSIGVAKLRGVESEGMLCSAKEIGLDTKLLPKEQTVGLYVLPDDAPVGEAIVSYLSLDDVVLEVSLTPNRSDCLSMRGFAYEIAAIFHRTVKFPSAEHHTDASGPSPVKVEIETPLCGRYEAQAFGNLRTVSSPIWMQMRLMAMGVRPISLVVDITNYVMLEWGQPLHAFDLDQVHHQTIVIRQGRDGEQIVTLDGEERQLTEDTIVIADPDRAIGIAGVMGGQNSEITADTSRVVLESAAFHATSVRKTGQRMALRSEAQQRFEKGIDTVAVRGALVRATELFCELAGATLDGGIVSASANADGDVDLTRVEFSPDRCNARLGTDISPVEMKDILERLGLMVEAVSDGMWLVTVPSRRPDISIEADLIEEVARLAGYERIPSSLPHGATTVGVRNTFQALRKRSRDVLLGCGMTEVLTYSLTHPSEMDKLRIEADSPLRNQIPLLRPMSEERTTLRTHMLPGLANVATHNLAHGVQGGAIFEISRVYLPKERPMQTQPRERSQWSGLWFGNREAMIGERTREYDFYDAKGVVEVWLSAFGWRGTSTFVPTTVPWLHPGRSAEVVLGGERVGVLGELHPETANAFELGRAIYAEFDLDTLVSHVTSGWRVASLPRFPASRRDLAVLVDKAVRVGDMVKAAEVAASDADHPSILEDCHLFDIYTGTGVAEGAKSLAFALTYRAEDRTLTDEEIVAMQERVLAAWTKQFGAVLRSS